MAWCVRLSLGVLALAAATTATAQRAPRRVNSSCNGDTITAIDIHSAPPNVAGSWRPRDDIAGLHHQITSPRVIKAYLSLAVGQLCTERNRSESERLLRLQTFIASAVVRAIPDGDHRVRVEVETVDEMPLVGGLSMEGIMPTRITLGSENAFGQGLTIEGMEERGDPYRAGYGLNVAEYGAFNGPYTLAGTAERDPLGGSWSAVFTKPFLTDLDRTAFHTGASEQRAYYPIIRPSGDNVAMSVRRSSYDAGGVTRIGQGRVVGVLGVALLGETVNVGANPVIVSDSGLVPVIVTADSALGRALPPFRVTRLAAIGGLRALHFVTVSAFDALTAQQDLAEGIQFAALAGPSMLSSTTRSDVFVSGDMYSGFGDASSFFTLRAIAEGREERMQNNWESMVASSRLAWYTKPWDLYTQTASLEVSGIQHLDFPVQLTFQDHLGGLPGYPDATFAGGQRAVVRLEERRLLAPLSTRADAAVGLFADAGKLWAGDVPYGVTTSVHTSVGISLFTAIPAGAKRTYRLDFAVPLNRQPGGSRFELRFSSEDRTRLLWVEPADIARARAGAATANLLSWTPQ